MRDFVRFGATAIVFDDASLRTAVQLWFDDSAACEQQYGHISHWNTSNVTDMSFQFQESFNEPLYWNTQNVTTMENMFSGCEEFNQPLHFIM